MSRVMHDEDAIVAQEKGFNTQEGLNMPNTITVDMSATFAQLLLMSVAPKTVFGSDQLDITKQGEKKYVAEVAATPLPDGPIAVRSEILAITITGGDEAAMLAIAPGSPVTLDKLRMGVSPVERTEKGVRGGRPWFQGTGLRSAAAPSYRAKSDAA